MSLSVATNSGGPLRVLMIGATGMVARPIARALAADPRFEVSALVRDPERAAKMIPASIRLRKGDVRDRASLEAALQGSSRIDAVYTNFNTPFSARASFDPDRDGTAAVLEAAKSAGVRRFARTSALGVPEDRQRWWAIERKTRTDELVMNSGLEWTIFRPTWLCECLALFVQGPFALQPRSGDFPIWWISGADFGRAVANALATPTGVNRVVPCQGPEGVSIPDAVTRFARATGKLAIPVPLLSMRLSGVFSPQARYGVDLITMSRRWTAAPVSQATWRDFGAPTERIEDYAASIARTGDWPRK